MVIKYLCVLLTFCFASCKTISVTELQPEAPLLKKLPRLEARVDIYSLENAYASVAYGITSTAAQRIIPLMDVRPSSYRDPKIQDALIVYDREVSDNMITISGNVKGYMVFKVISGGPKKGGNFLAIINFPLLYIPNLLGVPIGNHQTEFEIGLDIYDNKNNLIGKYIGYGKHKTWIRVGGYSGKDAQRMANIRALKKAFAHVKKQINDDVAKLESALQD